MIARDTMHQNHMALEDLKSEGFEETVVPRAYEYGRGVCLISSGTTLKGRKALKVAGLRVLQWMARGVQHVANPQPLGPEPEPPQPDPPARHGQNHSNPSERCYGEPNLIERANVIEDYHRSQEYPSAATELFVLAAD